MTRRIATAAAAATALLVITGGASARDAVARPGVSVGKIKLGMTEAQLRAAMGKPNYVVEKAGTFGRVRVEYQYGALAEWSVELAGPRGNLRVTSVLTYLKSQRLPNGLGVGTRERTLTRTYGRRLECQRWPTYTYRGIVYVGRPYELELPTRTCSLPGPAGAATIFVSKLPGYERMAKYIPQAVVQEVGVRVTSR